LIALLTLRDLRYKIFLLDALFLRHYELVQRHARLIVSELAATVQVRCAVMPCSLLCRLCCSTRQTAFGSCFKLRVHCNQHIPWLRMHSIFGHAKRNCASEAYMLCAFSIPKWVEPNGACPTCASYESRLAGCAAFLNRTNSAIPSAAALEAIREIAWENDGRSA
jgi:hypothetical protein